MSSSKRKPVDATPLTQQAFEGLSALRDALPKSTSNSDPTTAQEAPAPAEPNKRHKITLQREKKGRAGKTVTRVKGLTLDAAQRSSLVAKMKKALGCGATVEGEDIVLLANIGPRAKTWLEAEGYQRVVLGNG